MLVNGKHYHTIWINEDNPAQVDFIDQRLLPFKFQIASAVSVEDMYQAIKIMQVRGAPLIGVAGAFGVYLACLLFKNDSNFEEKLIAAAKYLISSRPTAVNLSYAVENALMRLEQVDGVVAKTETALNYALELSEQEVLACKQIGEHGLALIEEIASKKPGETINVLTHCNAGWLACIDYGTATAPIYAAFEKGIDIHVWVDETRPRNQGARLTAWELGQHGVPYTIISDNNGGHLMQHALVDLCIVGSDRTTSRGDVANKIGTYLKALAAKDNNIPFYVALPSSSIDFNMNDGLKEIEIEQRTSDEVGIMEGISDGVVSEFKIIPENSSCRNDAFDVTPARLVTRLITERGVCEATAKGIKSMFPEK